MEERYQQRIAELEKTLLERDAKIAQLRLQHQKQFKKVQHTTTQSTPRIVKPVGVISRPAARSFSNRLN